MQDERKFLSEGSIVQDYSEFSKIPIDTVVERILSYRQINQEDFTSRDSYNDFYANSTTYIYDLLSAHPNMEGPVKKIDIFLPGVLGYIKEHPGTEFLEFGGGIGDICQYMATWGNKNVTYLDIDSHITHFAKWRFEKYNVPVEMKIIPQDSLSLDKQYDFIYQDAVLEHLTAEQQISYSVTLAKHLNPTGVFVMIVDLAGESEDMPMHYNVDIKEVHNAIEKEGIQCHYGKYNFASVWTRP